MSIKIVVPGTAGKLKELNEGIQYVTSKGLTVDFDADQMQPDDPSWPYASSSVARRSSFLAAAFESSSAIWSARGGYGCSDLLPVVAAVVDESDSVVIGFSDVSAIHSAIYALASKPSLHAPMLASELWQQPGGQEPLNLTIDFLKGALTTSSIKVDDNEPRAEGTLFGGCLSVLTNLIGTPYLPNNFEGHILFFEDIDENPGKIWRNVMNWHQAGLFKGVEAIVLGNCVGCFSATEILESFCQRLHKTVGVPVLNSRLFGHIPENYPIAIGVKGRIEGGQLSWTWER